MKILFKTIFYLTGGLLLLLIATLIYIHTTLPVYDGNLATGQLEEETEVIFDEYGIPHIYAQNVRDAYFTLGYIHGQERLFQMEMIRRLASGRLAEILGESLAETDKFFRVIGIKDRAAEIGQRLKNKEDMPYMINLDHYLKGLNYFISNGKPPVEFTLLGIEKEQYTIEDIHLLTGYMSFSFSIGANQDPLLSRILNNLGDKYLEDFALETIQGSTVIPVHKPYDSALYSGISKKLSEISNNGSIPALRGSNSWVIGPEKTKNGKVILCNDTHIPFSQPGTWYESHIEFPGLSLYGNFLAGFPYPLIGHTREIAWGLTMLENDDFDFIQLVTDENKEMYKYRGQWLPFTEKEIIIKVKGKPDISFTNRMTRFGPVVNQAIPDISDDHQNLVACWWAYSHVQNNELEALHELVNSSGIQDVDAAAAKILAPGLNLMYGDSQDNIAWWGVARLLKRDRAHNSKFILNGEDSSLNFDEFHDFSFNPKAINPAIQYVYSANNQPESMDGDLYPGYYAPEYRADRITRAIGSENQWDVDKASRLISDDRSYVHPEMGRIMAELTPGTDDEFTKLALDILSDWDGTHDISSIAPTIYYRFLYQTLYLAMADELGENDFHELVNTHLMKNSFPLLIKNGSSTWWDNQNTQATESRQDILSEALRITLEKLRKQLGSDLSQWNWGKIHSLEVKHPIGLKKPFNLIFNVGPHAVPGGLEVINNLSFNLQDENVYDVTYGPAMRIVIDFADIENSISVLPTGQSGHFLSPFYNDQAALYNAGLFRKQMMNREEIEEKAYGKLIFKAD